MGRGIAKRNGVSCSCGTLPYIIHCLLQGVAVSVFNSGGLNAQKNECKKWWMRIDWKMCMRV